MTSRERLHACFNYHAVDYVPFTKPWLGFPETFERWRTEGYEEGAEDRYPYDVWHWEGGWFFPTPPFERRVVEETDRHVLYVNHEGILMRELRDNPLGSMPQFVRFPVETREDFRKFFRERMQPTMEARIGEDWVAELERLREGDAVLWLIADRWGGFFGPPRNLLGVENLCMLFYTDPAFIEELLDAFADFIISVVGKVLDRVDIDVFGFWEDMAYNHGPLIGPDMVRQFMVPRYKRVVEYLRSRGVRWISLDSDGRVDTLVPLWLDAGINVLYPFEVAAGMDVTALRKTFGTDMRIYMGLDKRALAQDCAAIDREFDRVRPLIEAGGYIPNLDHSIPPDVSYDSFQYYMDRLMRAVGM